MEGCLPLQVLRLVGMVAACWLVLLECSTEATLSAGLAVLTYHASHAQGLAVHALMLTMFVCVPPAPAKPRHRKHKNGQLGWGNIVDVWLRTCVSGPYWLAALTCAVSAWGGGFWEALSFVEIVGQRALICWLSKSGTAAYHHFHV